MQKGDRIKGCTIAIVTLALPLDLRAAVVTLKVRELAGVPRQAEPVTCGVPFPQGRIKTVDHLALNRGDGMSLPASFTVINRWPTDGSIRWALLDALISVPAGGVLDLNIIEAQPIVPAVRVKVQDDVDQITVNTGKINFTVRKKGFRLFESFSLEGRPVLAACPEGLAMTIAGKRYTSAADEQSAVMIEEQNPIRVTIVARGKLSGPGQDKYDYEIRMHAFAGSPLVKLVPTIVKKYGPPRVVNHTFEDLSATFKLAGQPPWNYLLGSDAAPVTGQLAAGQSAHVLVRKSTEWVFGGAASGGGNPKEGKPLGLGWAGLASDTCGLAVGVHRFWQTFPKAIVLGADGTLEVGLYPKLIGTGQQFFTGMARTHEIWLWPYDGKTSPKDLHAIFVGFQKPVLAAASPDWYCRETGVFGTLAPAGARLVGEAKEAFAEFDRRMSGYFDQLLGPARDKRTKRGVTLDAYGWLAFGDTLHWVWHDPKSEGTPWDIAWDSNYYDLAHIACAWYVRSGDPKYLEWFRDQTWHFMDIDVVHWDPAFPNGGASRRCPATNHVGFDPPDHMQPIINVAFDHHKSESLFERYYLLGDRRAIEVAMDLAQMAYSRPDADYGGTRKPAHQIITLVAAYWHTADRKYLARARKIIDAGIQRQNQFDGFFNTTVGFTDGILLEAFGKYWLATGEKDVLEAMRRFCDKLAASDKLLYTNLAFGHALVYKETGEKKYLETALKLLGVSRPGHLSKDMGHMFRNVANTTGLLLE